VSLTDSLLLKLPRSVTFISKVKRRLPLRLRPEVVWLEHSFSLV
jgi:hypothetical protein